MSFGKTVTQIGIGRSRLIRLEPSSANFAASIFCEIEGTPTYTVKFTGRDVDAPDFNPATAKFFDVPALTNKTVDGVATFENLVRGVVVDITAAPGGNADKVTMTILQSGLFG